MRDKNNSPNTEKPFALSIFLLNILILLAIIGVVWLIRTAIGANRELDLFLHGGFLS